MKHRFVWASSLALAFTLCSQINTSAITNGVIYISTREPQDTASFGQDSLSNQEKGPGMCTPGDVAMGLLLGDYGYTTRVLLDRILGGTAGTNGFYWCSADFPGTAVIERDEALFPFDLNMTPALVIISGSSAGAAVPFPTITNGIPMMMGEHTTLGSGANVGSFFMYDNTLGSSSDPNQGNTTNKHMKVLNPNHPILQGIPLDSEGRVKIWRDAYPEENSHLPVGGKANYEFRWCTHSVAAAAEGTEVLGVMSGVNANDDTNRACLAVCEVGGKLANGASNEVRLVHFFVNEQGSGGSRRIFTALTDLGKVIFVRAAKWAMGETLTPYQPLGLIQVSQINPTQIELAWQGTASKNYKIIGTANLAATSVLDWQTVAEDIPGVDGTVTAKLDISSGPPYAFLRVMPVP